MTKHTTRDRIWSAALKTAAKRRGARMWRRRFGATEVANEMDDPASNRSIRDTLATMADLGHLENTHLQGKYEPVDEPQPDSAPENRNDASGSTTSESRNDASGLSSTSSSSTTASEPASADDVALQIEDADDAGDETDVTDALADVEFPTTKDREECVEAVEAAHAHLQAHETATMREFVAEVLPEHPVGYEVVTLEEGDRYRGAWWRNVVKPGLEALPDVEKPPTGGSEWRYNP